VRVCNCEAKAPETSASEISEIPSELRCLAYARRAAQVLVTKGRLVAYTSDIGESVRPVVPPWVVTAAYGITWAYVGVDVGLNTAEEHLKGSPPEVVARTAVHTATFQTIASVLLPSLIIHQAVHLAERAVHILPPTRLTRWIPSIFGLALIPVLPYIDEPVEHVIDLGFEKAWPKPDGGTHAVPPAAAGA